MGRPKKTKTGVKKVGKRKNPLQSVRGMHDILPVDQKYWDHVINNFVDTIDPFGFQKIETPTLERTELFARGIGDETDIVSKEMFTFTDKSGDSLTLRPEWTAGIARAYIEKGMSSLSQPVKLFATGPLFRHERPQSGRYRQFHQLDLEVIGDKNPIIDAQVIFLAWKILQNIGLKDIEIQINSVGCPECRHEYNSALASFLSAKKNRLCADCKKRSKKNALRVFDCKNEKCQSLLNDAPDIIDSLCEECHNHFKIILEYMDELAIPYNLNSKLVRGLDYYTKTTFEIWYKGSKEKPVELALGGGGRYDNLVELLGGRPTPAVGIALGIERIVDLLKEEKINISEKNKKTDVLLIQLGNLAKKKSLHIFDNILENGIKAKEALHKSSIKSQLRLADNLGAKFAVIIGQKEVLDGTALIRNMQSGIQEIVSADKLIPEIKERLRNYKKDK